MKGPAPAPAPSAAAAAPKKGGKSAPAPSAGEASAAGAAAPKKGGGKPKLPESAHAGPSEFAAMNKALCAPAASWAAFNASLPPPLAPAAACAPGCGKILSVNVNGMRALLSKVGADLQGWLAAEGASVLVLQEVKADVAAVAKAGLEKAFPALPHARFACSGPPAKKGYSGVAIFSAHAPLAWHEGVGVPGIDAEGRVLAAEFDHHFIVVVYVPNSGQKLDRLAWRTEVFDPAFAAYLQKLQARKPVVVLGDFNVAYHDFDVTNPKAYRNKIAGFCDAERDNWLRLLLGPAPAGAGLVDAWREANPAKQLFTYYSIMRKGRESGSGWRIDGSLVSPALMPRVRDAFVRGTIPSAAGLDHLPVGLTLV
jgi:exodeoxyribonuclease-3